jgi:hypothetical protein
MKCGVRGCSRQATHRVTLYCYPKEGVMDRYEVGLPLQLCIDCTDFSDDYMRELAWARVVEHFRLMGAGEPDFSSLTIQASWGVATRPLITTTAPRERFPNRHKARLPR